MLNSVTEETYYDNYDQNLGTTWQIIQALHQSKQPALRLELATAAVAMFDKTDYPDDSAKQRLVFERFFALYELGRQDEANELLGKDLTGQFLRDYLPDHMQGITVQAGMRQGQLAIDDGRLQTAGYILSEAANDIRNVGGPDTPQRITTLMASATSYALVGDLEQGSRPLTNALDEGGISAAHEGTLAWRVGEIRLLEGRLSDAAAMFDRAQQLLPLVADIHNPIQVNRALALAHVFSKVGRNAEALDLLAGFVGAAGQDETAEPMTRSRILARAGHLSRVSEKPNEARALYRAALDAVEADSLPDLDWRGELLSLHAALGGGVESGDPYNLVEDTNAANLNAGEAALASRAYRKAETHFSRAMELGGPADDSARAELGKIRVRYAAVGPEPEIASKLFEIVGADAQLSDAVKAAVLSKAVAVAIETNQLSIAAAALEKLEDVLFANRNEGHADLYRVASLRATYLLKTQDQSTNPEDVYEGFGALLQNELHKLLFEAAKTQGLTSPVLVSIMQPQVHFGLWKTPFVAGTDSTGRPRVRRTDSLARLQQLHHAGVTRARLVTELNWALSVLSGLWHSSGPDAEATSKAGAASLAEIERAEGDSYLAREAAYLRSLVGAGQPRPTEIIRAKQALEARGFVPRAVVAILFGGANTEDPRVAEILRYRIRRDYGFGSNDYFSFTDSMMTDLAYDPETQTHIGFAPFSADGSPTNSLTERVANVSDCLKDARPWVDCKITYAPLSGGRLTPEESEACRQEGVNAEQRSAIEIPMRKKIREAEKAENWELSGNLDNQLYEQLEASGLSEFFPVCWVYEKGPGVIDPSAAKVAPQIDLSRIIEKKKQDG